MSEDLILNYDYIPAFSPVYDDDKPYYFFWGGRGGGKSYFVGDYLIDKSYTETGVYLNTREIQNTIATSNYALLKGRIKERNRPSFNINKNNITNLRTGTDFIFHGLSNITKDNIKSTFNVKRAWSEESQTLTKESIEILYPTVRDNDSHLYFSLNRKKESDPIFEFFKTFGCKSERLKTKVDGKYFYWYLHWSKDAMGINLNWDGNPYFPDKLNNDRLRDQETLPDFLYEHIWNGKPEKINDSTILTNIAIHDFDQDTARQQLYGMDFGYVDSNAITQSYIYDGELYIFREWYRNNLDPDQLKREVLNLDWLRLKHVICDGSRPELIKMLNSTGYLSATPARKSVGQHQREGAYKYSMALYMKTFKVIHVHKTNCPNLSRELPEWSFETDKNGEVFDTVQDGKDHAIDSLIYAIERQASIWYRSNFKR